MTTTIEDVLKALDDLVYVAKRDDELKNSDELLNAQAVLVCVEIDGIKEGDHGVA